jgi:hypothetical protein
MIVVERKHSLCAAIFFCLGIRKRRKHNDMLAHKFGQRKVRDVVKENARCWRVVAELPPSRRVALCKMATKVLPSGVGVSPSNPWLFCGRIQDRQGGALPLLAGVVG